MTTGEMITYIQAKLPEEEILAQLAEEASELAQAALKKRRAMDGRNFTPVTPQGAERELIGEIQDVRVCLMVLDHAGEPDDHAKYLARAKLRRWVERLGGNPDGKAEEQR